MPRNYKPIELAKEEKELLEGMLSKGFYQSKMLRRARILIMNHEHHCPTILHNWKSVVTSCV